jgi:hypothetical protein
MSHLFPQMTILMLAAAIFRSSFTQCFTRSKLFMSVMSYTSKAPSEDREQTQTKRSQSHNYVSDLHAAFQRHWHKRHRDECSPASR